MKKLEVFANGAQDLVAKLQTYEGFKMGNNGLSTWIAAWIHTRFVKLTIVWELKLPSNNTKLKKARKRRTKSFTSRCANQKSSLETIRRLFHQTISVNSRWNSTKMGSNRNKFSRTNLFIELKLRGLRLMLIRRNKLPSHTRSMERAQLSLMTTNLEKRLSKQF